MALPSADSKVAELPCDLMTGRCELVSAAAHQRCSVDRTNTLLTCIHTVSYYLKEATLQCTYLSDRGNRGLISIAEDLII